MNTLNAPLSVGIIGLGRVGMEFDLEPHRPHPSSHIGAFTNNSQTYVKAVCDTDKMRGLTALHHFSTRQTETMIYFSSIAEMSASWCDIVVVATPTPTHRDIIKMLLKESPPRLIFCEKPLAESIQDCRDLVELCEDAGTTLMVNHTRRFDPIYQWGKELVTNKTYGDLLTMTGQHPAPLLRSGSHLIDLFLWYIGEPIEICFVGSRDNWVCRKDKTLTDYSGVGLLTYIEGQVGVINCWQEGDYVLFELDLLFERGRVRIYDNGSVGAPFRSAPSRRYKGLHELLPQQVKTPQAKPTPMANAVQNIVGVLQKGEAPLCDGQSGADVTELIVAAHASMLRERWVRLPLDAGDLINNIPALNYVVASY